MNSAFVFPGQGSQQLGMLADFATSQCIQSTFQEASNTLNQDLWALAQKGPESLLNETRLTQPLLLTAGIALFRLWCEQQGEMPSVMAGHSLGEYTAFVAANALSLQDGVRLTSLRGELMQKAIPIGVGKMAAIVGLSDEVVEAICEEAAENQVVSPANYNAVGQVVISGHAEAVDRACFFAEKKGAKLTVPLTVSVPSHCLLMQSAAEEFAAHLDAVTLQSPTIPVIHNVDVSTSFDTTTIRKKLLLQLYSPVRWVETIHHLKTFDVQRVLEFGPGRVLTGLSKRIDRQLPAFSVHDQSTFQMALLPGESLCQ